MRRLGLIAVLAVGLATASAGGALAATTQRVSADGLTATFSFSGRTPDVHGARLAIARAGQVLYDQPVSSPACGTLCGPGEFGPGSRSVGIAPLQPGPGAQVILELYSGGANCCFVDQVFSYDPGTQTFTKAEQNFGVAGARIQPIGPGRRLEFRSADPRFEYAFTDGADSGLPLQIWQFGNGSFSDVTRGYGRLLRADAARWLRLFNGHIANGVGLIAAWAADEELLHRDAAVQAWLRTLLAQGRLRSGPAGHGGRRFVADLNRLLTRAGYRN